MRDKAEEIKAKVSHNLERLKSIQNYTVQKNSEELFAVLLELLS